MSFTDDRRREGLPGVLRALPSIRAYCGGALAPLLEVRRHRNRSLWRPARPHPGIVAAIREHVGRREVVFAQLQVSYRLAAYALVSVAAAPPAHVANTHESRPRERRDDVLDSLARTPRRACAA